MIDGGRSQSLIHAARPVSVAASGFLIVVLVGKGVVGIKLVAISASEETKMAGQSRSKVMSTVLQALLQSLQLFLQCSASQFKPIASIFKTTRK